MSDDDPADRRRRAEHEPGSELERALDLQERETRAHFLSALARSILDAHADLHRDPDLSDVTLRVRGQHLSEVARAARALQELRVTAAAARDYEWSAAVVTDDHVALADQVLRRVALGLLEGDPYVLGHLRSVLQVFDGTSRVDPLQQERCMQALRALEEFAGGCVAPASVDPFTDIGIHRVHLYLEQRIDPAFRTLRDQDGPPGLFLGAAAAGLWSKWLSRGAKSCTGFLVDLARLCGDAGALGLNPREARGAQVNRLAKVRGDVARSIERGRTRR